jgi:hypothetical protein
MSPTSATALYSPSSKYNGAVPKRWNSTAERFWSKVDTTDADGCWLWTRARNALGYGSFSTGVGSQTMLAHRMAYTFEAGPIPEGISVCHTCDVPACVRPDHLFLGTNSDNQLDSSAKGRHWTKRNPTMLADDRNGSRRHPERLRRGTDNWFSQHPERVRGEANAAAILTESQVLDIRRLRNEGWSLLKLSQAFGVSQASVSMISNGKRWRHI